MKFYLGTHQPSWLTRTIIDLRSLAPDLPIVPTIQGFRHADYVLRTNSVSKRAVAEYTR
ncbi:hypothetical protein ACFXPS_42575 [Nocardia sp. NPDC059091]|uniref:hypothetical protein n=1 Tax=unclassified Nocardia TaxID=2637762 RepID=UPI0036A8A403